MKNASKVESLLLLTGSLSKSEKRYFRLLSQLQAGNKVYLYLFDLLEKNNNITDIYSLFAQRYPDKNIEVTAKHLYKVILDSLIRLREKQDMQTQIFNYISKANILFERELVNEAFAELEKALDLAVTYENDPLILLVYRTELKYCSTLNFSNINEKQLVNKQMKIHEVMKYTRSINLHLQLYDILKYRSIYKGTIRSDKQKEYLNDLVLSELNLMANNSYHGFEAEKLHLLFQASYYMEAGNYKSALRLYEELMWLFEENAHLWLNPPIYYVSALKGILDSLHTMKLYDDMPIFLGKLAGLKDKGYATEFSLQIQWLTYGYQLISCLNTGKFEEALQLYKDNEEGIYKKAHLLNPESQLKLLLYTSLLFISIHDFTNARKHIKKIFLSDKTFHTLPSYKIARLVYLLLLVELDKTDAIENEINSIKRDIQFERQVYATEKLLFKFVLAHPLPAYSKSREKMWGQYKKEMDKIRNNKYERQLLKTFDFLAWMESKLTKRPFGEVLREKV